MGSLIAPEATSAIWSVLFLAAAIGFWIDKSRFGRVFSGAAAAVLFTLILANVGVLPNKSAPYSVVFSDFVPFAIPLLLFKANLFEIARSSGALLVVFLIAACGTILGTLLGVLLLDLGELEPTYAGVMAATYIGGSLNFAATADALEFTDSTLLAAALAADNLAGIIFLVLLASLPAIAVFRKFYGMGDVENENGAANATIKEPHINLFTLTAAASLSFAIVFVSDLIATSIGQPSFSILFVTAIAIALATLFPNLVGKLHGDYELGIALMYVFFAAVGAGADVSILFGSAANLFVFAALIIIVHFLVLFGTAKLLRIPLPEIVIASCSCIFGPSVSAAIAGARDWNHLVTPGILTGVFGYATATFIGVSLANWLQ